MSRLLPVVAGGSKDEDGLGEFFHAQTNAAQALVSDMALSQHAAHRDWWGLLDVADLQHGEWLTLGA